MEHPILIAASAAGVTGFLFGAIGVLWLTTVAKADQARVAAEPGPGPSVWKALRDEKDGLAL